VNCLKKILKILIFLVVAAAITLISCKKERSCEKCNQQYNEKPIANAGRDTTIVLPVHSVLLDGSLSIDPDGTITSYSWAEISGPSSYSISNASNVKTEVRSLKTGRYLFELDVIDDGGLTGKDTVRIIVDSAATPNHRPVANAGPDRAIILPANSAIIDGSTSYDTDNNIFSYHWTKISGPFSFTIVSPNAVQTQVNNLVQGVYQFELTVIDAAGLSSKDSMRVTVDLPSQTASCPPNNRSFINGQVTLFGNLSIPRTRIATVAAGNKIFFAGGSDDAVAFSRVDIYDMSSRTWSTAELSLPREGIKAVTCGNKVFFAGGINGSGGVSRVDIYDLATQSWSTAELTYPVANWSGANYFVVAAVGSKVLFANPLTSYGYPSGLTTVWVDIYDVSNQSWSSGVLSEPRFGFNAVTAENKVYFSGGVTNDQAPTSRTIDIYDNSTGNWSTSTLTEPKAWHGGVYKNRHIFWAGGSTYSDAANGDSVTCNVEVKDINSKASAFDHLYQPNYGLFAHEINSQLAFLPIYDFRRGTSLKFDIYDVSAGNWGIGVVNQMPSYFLGSPWVVLNNSIFVAGGSDYCPGSRVSCQYHTEVWKIDF
jgi:hypothetical protein